ncbi:MAG TPA: O-antigen ligase family protein [Thermoleophilaceae bacterium]|nr:O-antigen ligase family protein [Thermoleophilaceae bacterium]
MSDPLEPAAPRRPAGAAMLGVALAALCAWALFSEGATSLQNEAGLQIAVCALALVALAGLLFSPRIGLRAPVQALAGLALLVVFAAWSGWSIGWSIAPDLSWVQLNRWATYALVVALALVLGSSLREAPRRTAGAYLVVATAVALYALGGKVLPWVEIPGLLDLDHTSDFSRVRAPLGYWNALGLVCVLAAPLAVRIAADPDSRPRARSLSTVALVLVLVTLGLTYSRGGILATLVALGALVAMGPDRLRLTAHAALGIAAAVPAYLVAVVRDDLTADGMSLGERSDDGLILLGALLLGCGLAAAAARRLAAADARLGEARLPRRWANARTAIAAAAVGLALAVGALAVSERGVTGTIERSWDDFTATKQDEQTDPSRVLRSNSGNRWVWWREAVGAFSDEPVRGWGAGSFPLVHRRYRSDQLSVRQAHSVPLQLLAETGLVGALLALGGLGLLGWAAAGRVRRADGRERLYVAALAGASIGWGVHMWFDWDSDIPGVTLPMLVFLGVLAARPPGASDAVEAVPPADDARASAGPRAAGLLAGALVLAGLAASAYLPWLAEDKAAEAALLSSVGDERALREAAKRAEEAMQLNPLSVEPVVSAIAIAQRRGRLGEVADLAEEAVERQPENPDAWLRAFSVQSFVDDAPARIESARRVLALDPYETRVTAGATLGDVASRSASATGTPLVVAVLPPPPPAIGPPAPNATPLIGPPQPASAGGTTVEPPDVSEESRESAPDRP